MIRENTCCFTGPRPQRLPENGNEYTYEIEMLKDKIRNAVIDAYNEGFINFMNGLAEGFDLFAAEEVISLKKEFPQIKLIIALPYKGAPKHHSPDICERMDRVLENSDLTVAMVDEHIIGCELIRDRYMVEHSERIIGYYNGMSRGTAYTWKYALESGLETVNLYDSEL